MHHIHNLMHTIHSYVMLSTVECRVLSVRSLPLNNQSDLSHLKPFGLIRSRLPRFKAETITVEFKTMPPQYLGYILSSK